MTNWIWFPGDYEIYHAMKQNFEREERGITWPAFWKSGNWNHSVKFSKAYTLSEETSFFVTAFGEGYVAVKCLDPSKAGQYDPYKEVKYPIGSKITTPDKDVIIEIVVSNLNGLPSAFVEGAVIKSDPSWEVTNFANVAQPVGCNDMHVQATQNPMTFVYSTEVIQPVNVSAASGGLLYDFGRELTAETCITFTSEPTDLSLCYGESEAEALDGNWCYQRQEIKAYPGINIFGEFKDDHLFITKKRAFRYIFVPNFKGQETITIHANHLYVDYPNKSSLQVSDELIEKIWNISEETFRLVSGPFFIDGVKRDGWIWSGDAYQSYFVNRYLFFDQGICERTILALRGNEEVYQHINGILDYSLFWIISIADNYTTFGNKVFLKQILPKLERLWEYCLKQTNELGFIYGRENDWVFIDWANIDKGSDKIISEEQILLVKCYESMIVIYDALEMETQNLKESLATLSRNIRKYFWDEGQGAFIDSYSTGRNKVSRHSNLLAVVFNFADEPEKTSIMNKVIFNPEIEAITTPYFKFYEMAALAELGQHEMVLTNMKEYWGGMIERGASTFWEEFDPNQSVEEQYSMYDDPYGKSLCHAWGANPIFIISRYFAGLYPTKPGYETFCVEPRLEMFEEFSTELPVKNGAVEIIWKNKQLAVKSSCDGGILKVENNTYNLRKNEVKKISLDLR